VATLLEIEIAPLFEAGTAWSCNMEKVGGYVESAVQKELGIIYKRGLVDVPSP